MDEALIKKNIADEAQRIMEDTEYSAKGHFAAASRFTSLHFWIGLISTVFAAAAGTSALSKFENGALVAGVLAFVVAILTALITFIKPNDRASQHLDAGNKYLTAKNKTRLFVDVELPQLSTAEATQIISNLGATRNELNLKSPIIPRFAFVKARKGIEQGETQYKIDREK
jgi:hypothetical protein